MFLACILGVATWSILEYWIHRQMGHGKRAKGNIFGREHTAHHSKGNYFAPWWKKAGAAVVVVVLITPPSILLVGLSHGVAYVAGFVGFYLFYEIHHWLLHRIPGFSPYGIRMRQHHFYHHFHNPKLNHGVTSPLWDYVFRTYHPTKDTLIRVPRKLAMPWLLKQPEAFSKYELR